MVARATKTIRVAPDVQRDLQTVGRALHHGVDRGSVGLVLGGEVEVAALLHRIGRHDDAGQQHAGRGRDDRGGQHVGGGVGQHVMQDGGVGDHGRAGHAGHADRDQHEEFRARQLVEIGADEDRAFDLAHEDGGGGGQGRRAAQAQRLLEDEAEALGHPLQDLPVPQQRRQRADHQDHRHDAEGEDEARARIADRERLVAARQEAEHEGGAGLGGAAQPLDRAIDAPHHLLGLRQAEQDQHEQHLDDQGSDREDPGESLAILGNEPAKAQSNRQTRQGLHVLGTEHQNEEPYDEATPPRRRPRAKNDTKSALARKRLA
jgi:hypothetical protein